MSTPSSVPRAPSFDDGDSPLAREQRHGYRFNGRILLSAVVILTILTVVFFLVRLLLFHVLLRGRGGGGGGGLAAGIRRSFGRLSSRRHGLDAAALAALPVTAYSKAEGGSTSSTGGGGGGAAENTDCAVCLSELADGEKVRALPGCAHVFHVECVDEWLRTRTTCPVCRAEVVAPPKDPEAGLVGTSTTLVVTVVEGGAARSRTSLSLGSSAHPPPRPAG